MAETWIRQYADARSATVDQMVTFLADEYGLKRHEVDNFLWEYCPYHQRVP